MAKNKNMDRKLTEQELEEQKRIIPNKFCLHCVHRKRFALNEHSNKVQICCEMQPSKRSNSGYQTIKAHDYACGLYKQKL